MSIAKIDLKLKLPKTFNCEIGYMANVNFRPTTKPITREILFT